MLHRLVYWSHNRVRSHLGREVAAILDASCRRNREVGVTGALMFNAGCFAQVLEGERHHVEDTFERIQNDPRHGDVSVLALDEVGARLFGHWSMGFVGARVDDAASFAPVGAASGFDLSAWTGDDLLGLLVKLARDEERRVA